MYDKLFYEKDVEARNKDNYIKDETYSVVNTDNDFRVIAPKHRPFFAKDLTIKHATSQMPLVLGTDYELVYKAVELEEIAAFSLYHGIQIINPAIAGELLVSYRTIGGEYVNPSSEAVSYVYSQLNDPVDIKYNNLNDRPTQFPVAEHSYNWHDHRNTQYLGESLDNIKNAIGTNNGHMDELIAQLTQRLETLKGVVDGTAFNLHVANMSNPHNLTPEQADALPALAAAKDALKAYGKTLVELSAWMIEHGINQSILDHYVRKDGTNPILTRLSMAEGFVFTNPEHTARLDLSNGHMLLDCTKSTLIQSNLNKIGAYHSRISSGEHSLEVASNGAEVNPEGANFNGHAILTGATVRNHIAELPQSDVLKLVFADTDIVKFIGSGTKATPLRIDLHIPTATSTVRGYSKVTTTIDNREDCAISISAVNELEAKLSGSLDNRRTINGHPLTADVNLTKADLGLSNVDNTAAANKPLSDAQTNAFAGKAEKVHSHTLQEAHLPDVTVEQQGIAAVTNSNADTSMSGKVLTPKALKPLKDTAADQAMKTRHLLPIKLDVDQFGGDSYLPVPAQGRYGAAGVSTRKWQIAGALEANGRWVFLRPGGDMVEEGVYYFYFDIDRNGSMANVQSTSTQYEPAFLRGKDLKVVSVVAACNNWMIVQLSDESYRLVQLHYTMNGAFHEAEVITAPSNVSFGSRISLFEAMGKLWIIAPAFDNDNVGLRLFYKSGSTFVPKTLSGTRFDGSRLTNVEYFKFNTKGFVNDGPNIIGAVAVRRDSGKWTHVGIRHAVLNTLVASSGEMARLSYGITSYCSNSTAGQMNGYTYSLNVNVNTGEVTADWPDDSFPLIVGDRGVWAQNSPGLPHDHSMPGSPANNTCDGFYIGNRGFSVSSYGNQFIPVIYTWNEANTPYLEMDIKRKRAFVGVASNHISGAYGSPITANPKRLHVLAGRWMIGINIDGVAWKAKYNTDGYGPSHPGLGPTSTRVRITGPDYFKLASIPSQYDGSQMRSGGFVITGPGSFHTGFDANNGLGTGNVIMSQSNYGTIKWNTANRPEVRGVIDGRDIIGHSLTCYRFPNNADFIQYCCMLKAKTADNKEIHQFTFRVQHDVKDGVLVNSRYLKFIGTNMMISNGTSISATGNDNGGGSSSYKLSDRAGYVYILQNGPYAGWVGNGGVIVAQVADDGDAFSEYRGDITYTYLARSKNVIPEFPGLAYLDTDRTGEYVSAVCYPDYSYASFTANNFSVGRKAVVSTRTKSSWMLYLTARVPLVINMTKYTLEPAQFDLPVVLGNRHQNKTINVGVRIANGKPEYFISLDPIVGGDFVMKVGTVTTDSERITDIDINQVFDMRSFRELEDHKRDTSAHGLSATAASAAVGLPHMRNARMINSMGERRNDERPEDCLMSVAGAFKSLYCMDMMNIQVLTGHIVAGSRLPNIANVIEYMTFPVGNVGGENISYTTIDKHDMSVRAWDVNGKESKTAKVAWFAYVTK